MLMESRTRDGETLARRTVQAATQYMRPEIYARFDEVCVFNRLSDDVLEQIAKLHLDRCLEIVRRQGDDITLSGSVLEYVLREGWSPEFGARPLQQAALRALGGAIVPKLLEGEGRAVKGHIDYYRNRNRCQLVAEVTG